MTKDLHRRRGIMADTDTVVNKSEDAGGNVSNLVAGGPFATSNIFIRFLYRFAILLKTPWWNCLDSLVAIFIVARKSPHLQKPILACGRDISFCVHLLKSFVFCILVILLSPLAIISVIMLLPLQMMRPRSYSYIAPPPRNKTRAQCRISSVSFHQSTASAGSYTEFDSDLPNLQDLPLIRSSRSSINMTTSTNNKLMFTIITANLCLMPKFVAYINNLSTSMERSRKIANYFIDGIMSKLVVDNSSITVVPTSHHHDNVDDTCGRHNISTHAYRNSTENMDEMLEDDDDESVSTLWSVTSKEKVVSDTLISPADFLCLQEVFDGSSVNKLLEGLKSRYPYIVYDVSWPVHDRLVTLLGSGLVVASRYKFIDISFKAFKDGHKDDKLACKGLLMTKVYVGKSSDGKDMVGYLSNTHLQAWSNNGASKARCKQLECIKNWINDFIQESSKRKHDSVEKMIFNVIAGDFNFDRISHFDTNEQKSEILKSYKDPCIDESGRLFNWVIGTELVQTRLHDDCVKTPNRLHKMLVSELERCQYVASTQPNKPTTTNDNCEDGKRKIDYILYRDCPQVKTTVKDFKFYTGLTTLTDHLPIGMTFVCDVDRT